MKTFDLRTLSVEPHKPQVLQSDHGEGRSIALHLPAGEQLQEHEVHERAYVVIVDGSVEIRDAGGETTTGGPGTLAIFEPHERHELSAVEDSRILMVLAPWPGEGHPGSTD